MYEYCLISSIDDERIAVSDQWSRESTREIRMLSRQANAEFRKQMLTVEELLYSPGIAE